MWEGAGGGEQHAEKPQLPHYQPSVMHGETNTTCISFSQHLNGHSVTCGLHVVAFVQMWKMLSVTAQSRVDYNTHAEFTKHGTLVFKERCCCNKQTTKKSAWRNMFGRNIASFKCCSQAYVLAWQTPSDPGLQLDTTKRQSSGQGFFSLKYI